METFTPSPYLIYSFPLNDIIILLKNKNKVNFSQISRKIHIHWFCACKPKNILTIVFIFFKK
jgi:hypothetical protein